ncbi:putative acetyltransferase [Gordonia araii NBRC 100433]|uniref:Putative acetyltransferase n=1 Tax=Gordonia araii NBRC 100433 TaxID=1073574 RepID=G7H5I0_9ACTN|nr:GNAT family N-acetyltransferase [Gordonia araii]NNG95818.1 GNAT family N-acetyltransferase [Gordonia araii NBRC 100433]GAB11105.1 putative acetyltransferase [Gordonia araii NBRC 100433]
MSVVEGVTDPALADDVAAVAAATFPLACPPHSAPADIAAYIDAHLSATRFAAHIADPESDVLVARPHAGGAIVGYSLVHHRPPADTAVAALLPDGPSSEISKVYVLPDHHAHRLRRDDPPAAALIAAAVGTAAERHSEIVWLGVNQENARAQRFYEKAGFLRVGTKTFDLNGRTEHDFVLVKRLRG